MYEEMEGVERVIERAQAAGTSRDIIVLLSVLRAEFMYKIGSMNSQIMATMVERSIDALGKAHVMVTAYGDIWLEVKVLRGLERGYVQVLGRQECACPQGDVEAAEWRCCQLPKCPSGLLNNVM
jgi:hypothetical protein